MRNSFFTQPGNNLVSKLSTELKAKGEPDTLHYTDEVCRHAIALANQLALNIFRAISQYFLRRKLAVIESLNVGPIDGTHLVVPGREVVVRRNVIGNRSSQLPEVLTAQPGRVSHKLVSVSRFVSRE